LALSNAAKADGPLSTVGDMNASAYEREGGQAGLKGGGEDKPDGQTGLRGDQDKLRGHKGSRTVRGEVLSVEGDIYYLQEQNGKAVRLHTDQTTKKIGNIHEGTSIEAEVNARGHALSIRSAESSDRRNEADRKG